MAAFGHLCVLESAKPYPTKPAVMDNSNTSTFRGECSVPF